MAVRVGVIDRPLRWNLMRGQVRYLKEHAVEVGVRGMHDAKNSNADILMFLELGTPTSPKRPVLTEALEANRARIAVLETQLADRVVTGRMPAAVALGEIGVAVVAMVQQKSRVGPWAPNAASTIAQKGSSAPTIDTEKLLHSFGYLVVTR